MSNLVVSSHILNLLQSDAVSESQDVLNVYDREFIDSLSSIDTTPLSAQRLTKTATLCSLQIQEIYDYTPINVKDFGAKGDGVTDDWLAIQRAIYHASWQWKYPGWPLATALSGDDQLVTVPFFSGVTRAIPYIWGGQGHQPVYFPTGDYLISKPIIITHGTSLYGDIPDKTRLMLPDSSNCSVIESKNLAIRRMHPDVYEYVDEWNANASIKNLTVRRKNITAAISNPNEKDWLPTTVRLSGVATNNFLTLASTYTASPLTPRELPIKLLYGDGTEYTVLSSTQTTVYITPALTQTTPTSGYRMMWGLPAMKGINVNGGENFTIEKVYAAMGYSGVGIFINGGSPGPVIRNSMCNANKYAYWVDNGPVLLDTPSGDANIVFVKAGTTRFSNVTINSCKIEMMSSYPFDFGGFGGSDACQYTLVGGTMNSTYNADPLSTCIVVRPAGTLKLLYPKITIQGTRFFMPGDYLLRTVGKYTDMSSTDISIPKGSVGGYPNYLFWEFGDDLITKWNDVYTVVSSNSATWETGGLGSATSTMFELAIVRNVLPSGYNKSTSTDSVATTAEGTGFVLVPGISANSWARVALTRVITNNPGDTGASNNATIPFAVATTFFGLLPSTGNAEIRIIVGDAGSGNPPPLSADCISGRGFGMRIYYSTLNARVEAKLFAHNGTTYVESVDPWLIDIPLGPLVPNKLANVILSTNGSGTIKAFGAIGDANGTPSTPSTTPVLTLAGGPTNSTYTGSYYSMIALNGNDSMGLTRVNVRGLNSMIHVGEVY